MSFLGRPELDFSINLGFIKVSALPGISGWLFHLVQSVFVGLILFPKVIYMIVFMKVMHLILFMN